MTRVFSYVVVVAFVSLVTFNSFSASRTTNGCPRVSKVRPDYCQTARFASECEYDSQCLPYKCCEQPCGNKMCNKPACPPVCDIYCSYGNVLDANGCPTCTCNPAPPSPTETPHKPGQCPPPPSGFTTCLASCENDYDCSDTQKCCTMGCGINCQKAQFSTKCPAVDTTAQCFAKDPYLCYTDSDCSGTPCCPTACGGTKCS